MKNTIYKNIAVMILGPLGDIINTSCVFSKLKSAYPNAKISIIASPQGKAAIRGIPEISEIYIYDRKKDKENSSISGILKYGFSLRGKFDLMIVLDNTLRAGLIAFLSGSKRRIGREGDLKKLLLTDTIPYLSEEKEMQIPVTEHYMRCLKPLGLYQEGLEPHFVYSQEDEKNVEKLFEQYNLKYKKLLGFCPMSNAYKKSLRIEDAAAFIKEVKEQTDYEIVILGGNDIKEYADTLEQKCAGLFVNLIGKTSFTESACVIDKCSKFVSIDTSQMHLAFAMKTPCVSVFFTNIYKKWGPRNFDINRLILNQESKEIPCELLLKNFNEIPDKL